MPSTENNYSERMHCGPLCESRLEVSGNYSYYVGMDPVLIICRHDLVKMADVFGADVQAFVLVFPEDGGEVVQEDREDLSSCVV